MSCFENVAYYVSFKGRLQSSPAVAATAVAQNLLILTLKLLAYKYLSSCQHLKKKKKDIANQWLLLLVY